MRARGLLLLGLACAACRTPPVRPAVYLDPALPAHERVELLAVLAVDERTRWLSLRAVREWETHGLQFRVVEAILGPVERGSRVRRYRTALLRDRGPGRPRTPGWCVFEVDPWPVYVTLDEPADRGLEPELTYLGGGTQTGWRSTGVGPGRPFAEVDPVLGPAVLVEVVDTLRAGRFRRARIQSARPSPRGVLLTIRVPGRERRLELELARDDRGGWIVVGHDYRLGPRH